jgi:hypothetical protein
MIVSSLKMLHCIFMSPLYLDAMVGCSLAKEVVQMHYILQLAESGNSDKLWLWVWQLLRADDSRSNWSL